MKLPPAPYDACDKVTARVSSSLVRYKNNDYSARYGHREVLAKGYVDRVVCRDETIAVHPRSYETADFIYNPLHYLALLEQKTRKLALRDLLWKVEHRSDATLLPLPRLGNL